MNENEFASVEKETDENGSSKDEPEFRCVQKEFGNEDKSNSMGPFGIRPLGGSGRPPFFS